MNIGQFTGYNPHPYPSPAVWGDCEFSELQIARGLNGPGRGGWAVHEDFHRMTEIDGTPTSINSAGKFLGIASGTGSTILGKAAAKHTARMLVTANNAACAFILGGLTQTANTYQPCANLTYGSTRAWAETRLAISSLVDITIFFGFLDPLIVLASTGANLADATGALLSTGNFVGIHAPTAASSVVAAGKYQKASTTAVTVASALHTFVADTEVKLGLRMNGRTLDFFVDGVSGGSVDLTSTTTPSDFPTQTTDLALALIFKMGDDDANDKIMSVDWIRAAHAY